MRIAVIGSGISGLSSAYYLSKNFEVDLFERNDYFGGHSFTYDIEDKGKTISVDLKKVTCPFLFLLKIRI